MYLIEKAYLFAFTGAVLVVTLAMMLFFDGHGDMNAYGEGWFEVVLAATAVVITGRMVRS